jgi:hypothetical protein
VYCKAVTTLPPPHPSWLVSQESNCWGLTLSSQVLLIHSRRKTSEKDTQYNEYRGKKKQMILNKDTLTSLNQWPLSPPTPRQLKMPNIHHIDLDS